MSVEVRVIRDDEWETFSEVFGTALGMVPPEDVRPTWRAVLDPDRIFGGFDDGRMVATAADFLTDLALPGGAAVPVAAVTAVGTLPTFRRRGAADALMRHQLASARERGDAAAVLHASEATIYERWGYGAAAPVTQRRIDTARSALRGRPDHAGRVTMLAADERREVVRSLHEATWTRTPGEIRRTDAVWDIRLFESSSGDGGPKTFVAHLGDDGEPDAFIGYRFQGGWDDGVPSGKLRVFDVAALTPEAHLAIWAWVLEMDLAVSVETGVLADDDPLLFALRDPRRAHTSYQVEGLWVRPLDVGRVLRERRWLTDGALTLHVTDPLFTDVTGGYRVTRSGAEATVERTDDEPDLRLGVSELGSLLLGTVPVAGLAGAGRVTARSDDALRLAARMLPADRSALCRTEF